MITKKDELRCDNCGKKLGENLQGHLEVVCPRCKHYLVFDSSSRIEGLDKKIKMCLE